MQITTIGIQSITPESGTGKRDQHTPDPANDNDGKNQSETETDVESTASPPLQPGVGLHVDKTI